MNILFLSRWFPYPTNNGSKLRIYNLLRGLNQHHAVTLLSFADQPDVSPAAPEIRSICSQVHVMPWKEFDPRSWRARLGFFSLKPRSIIDTFSPEMAHRLMDLLGHQQYDLIIASQLQMAAYAPYFGNVPALFEELEIGLSYEDSRRASGWRRLRHAFTWFKLRRYLARLLRAFRAVTVVSEQERELVRRTFPSAKDILVLPNCMNMADYRNIHVEPKPDTLVFTGSFRYHTNYEAMLWFVGKVFPLVLQQVPTAQLIITGDHADLPLPSMKNIILAGHVNDIKSLIASSTIALAPLWSGGGTRLKILEAMAVGTPVVATSKGAEGLEVEPGTHLFVADDPETFAEAVVWLLSEPQLRQRLAANGKDLVSAQYDWGSVLPELSRLAARISQV